MAQEPLPSVFDSGDPVNQLSQEAVIARTSLLRQWAMLHLLDAILTLFLFGFGGVEGNPLLAAVQSAVGGPSMLAVKISAAFAVGLVLGRFGRHRMLSIGNKLMGAVVVYNAALAVLTVIAASQ